MSQADLAGRTGIPKPRISQYENDRLRPSIGTLHRLASAMGVSETVLMTGSPAEAVFMAELRRLGVTLNDEAEAHRLAATVARLQDGATFGRTG